MNERYGEQLSLPDDFTCILEEDGGILFAPQAIKAYQVSWEVEFRVQSSGWKVRSEVVAGAGIQVAGYGSGLMAFPS